MSQQKNLVLALIKSAMSNAEDNLYRATMQFKHYTKEQMAEKYGEDDDSPNQIIDEYKSRKSDLKKAKEWVARCPD